MHFSGKRVGYLNQCSGGGGIKTQLYNIIQFIYLTDPSSLTQRNSVR